MRKIKDTDVTLGGRCTHIVAAVMYPPHEHPVRVLFVERTIERFVVEKVVRFTKRVDGRRKEPAKKARGRSHLEHRHDALERVEVDLGRVPVPEGDDRRDP